jgi:hypothetical protein
MTRARALPNAAGVLFVLLFVPLFALAQSDDVLRATIRADIMSDPRSAEMSPTEIDALVNALAEQAHEQGIAETYVQAQNNFSPRAEIPYYEPQSTLPTLVALLTLAIVLLAVVFFIIRHRGARGTPPSDGMVA